MKITRKLLCAALALMLMFSASATVFADNEDAVAPYVRQMINYFKYYQINARTDIARLDAEIGRIDAAQAEAWSAIMDEWSYVNGEMPYHPDVLPNGLPEDDSLCIVVLGYELQKDGSMKGELLGRLKAALASAEKYPNAYIACTGGATASHNPKATEAEKMADWLIAQGISRERIIIENKSRSTIQNAQFTYELLRDQYPQIKHLALVTSDYHLARGYMCFATRMNLGAGIDLDPYLDIVGNAVYGTAGGAAGSVASQASDIASIAGVSLSDTDKPRLSKLSYISVDGQTVYAPGDYLSITVTAYYDSGFSRRVTGLAYSTPVNMNTPGTQAMTITYTENGNQATAEIEITILPEDAQADVPALAEIHETIPATQATAPATVRTVPIALIVAAAALLALLIFFLRKLRTRK